MISNLESVFENTEWFLSFDHSKKKKENKKFLPVTPIVKESLILFFVL